MTRIFYHGKTYTYDKLPSFPKFESKPKQKPKRKTKDTVKTSAVPLHNSVFSVVRSIVDSLVTNVTLSVTENLSELSDSLVPVPDPTVSNFTLNPSASMFVSESSSKDCGTMLRDLRIRYMGNIIIAHLNINSLRYKFDFLKEMVIGNVDILVIGETKLDSSFPKTQFKISGFSKP